MYDFIHTGRELTTEFRSKPGFAGALERLLMPPVTRSIYRRELDNVNVYLTTGAAAR